MFQFSFWSCVECIQSCVYLSSCKIWQKKKKNGASSVLKRMTQCSLHNSTCSTSKVSATLKDISLHVVEESVSRLRHSGLNHPGHRVTQESTEKNVAARLPTPHRVLAHPHHMTRKWIRLKVAFKELNLKDEFPVPLLTICHFWCACAVCCVYFIS